MKRTVHSLLLGALCLFFSAHLSAQEICDNAIDDDGDGLIDLNDEDCECPVVEPLSLIPNPSFEDMNCCPQNRSQLGCAMDWIQASEPTTDYLHTCGWMGWNGLPPPLPFPDGEGCIGFRDGRPPDGQNGPGSGGGEPRPNWKEYAGACLTGPLQAGVEYRFEFYIGFSISPHSPPLTLTFFGTTDCDNLPFGVGDEDFGCPTNGPGWKYLGEVNVNGSFEWKLTEITVTPDEDIHAVAIGPSCNQKFSNVSFYYFFDNLVLASQQAFDYTIKAEGNPCLGEVVLNAPVADTLEYQWYFNGVALVGENDSELQNISEEGEYQVRLLGPNSCEILPSYFHKIPKYSTTIYEEICAESEFIFGSQNINTSGIYTEDFLTENGCDSTVTLILDVMGELYDTVDVKLLPSEKLTIESYILQEEGDHLLSFTSSMGCDSLALIRLEYLDIYVPNIFSPNGDGINDYFSLFLEDENIEVYDMQVYDRWGSLIFYSDKYSYENIGSSWNGMINGESANEGVYAYFFRAKTTDGEELMFSGDVTLIR